MKITLAGGRFFIHLGLGEKLLLLDVLKLYPRIPPAHHRLSKSAKIPDQEASQRLLDEALAEQRTETKKQLQTLLADPRRFQKTAAGARLCLTPAEVEWLLQVLNDIRVGSWVMLGSPGEKFQPLNERTTPHVWAMEMSGYFQSQLLQVLEGGEA